MWAARAIDDAEAQAFRAQGSQAGLLAQASVHASYLINLGAPEGDLREKSLGALADELVRCARVGVPHLVLHPGSNGEVEEGLALISAGAARAFELAAGQLPGTPLPTLLFETAAGQGNALGRTFPELRRLLNGLPERWRGQAGLCVDTCHVFAAGYDLGSEAATRSALAELEREVGLARVRAFHLNDSKKPLGCRVDRHELPGQGCIGLGAFRALVNDSRFQGVPGYLELPPEENAAALATLRGLRSRSAPDVGVHPTKRAKKQGAQAVARGTKRR